MIYKDLVTDKNVLVYGANLLADTIKSTLGPKGRYVCIADKFKEPVITNDGMTIAKNFSVKDPAMNAGIDILKEASLKTGDSAGDGTTTSCILAQSMINQGNEQLKNVLGTNPILLKKGMELACSDVVKELKEMSKEVKDKNDIFNVANIASRSEEIGNMISDIFDKIGKDGLITISNSQTTKTESEVINGFEFENGYMSSLFLKKDKNLVEMDDVTVFLYDGILIDAGPIEPFVQQLVGKNVLFMAQDIKSDALKVIIASHLKGIFNAVAVKTPGFGEYIKEYMKDIEAVTGAKAFGLTDGKLGSCKLVKSTIEKTLIVSDIKPIERIKELNEQLKLSNQYDSMMIKQRIAKMSSGIGIIKVGDLTQNASDTKKFLVEDAVEATKSAIEEGILPGGGVALYEISQKLSTDKLDGDIKTGYEIVKNALEIPIKQILLNAGVDFDIKKLSTGQGYNVTTDKIENMIESGIIDPTKVVRNSIENAVTVSGLFLIISSLIVEREEE